MTMKSSLHLSVPRIKICSNLSKISSQYSESYLQTDFLVESELMRTFLKIHSRMRGYFGPESVKTMNT